MNPKNFSNRKRQRQMGALSRLLASGRNDWPAKAEIAALYKRTADDLRDVRTKKDRSHTGRMSRA